MSAALRGGALCVIACVWLAACANDPQRAEKAGRGGSPLDRETSPSSHVTLTMHMPASGNGNDPDSVGTGAPARDASVAHAADAGSMSVASDGGSAVTPPRETGAPTASTSHHLLRDDPVGTSPVFDPDAVYMLGMNAEVGSNDPQEIAPVDLQTDSIAAIGWFSQGWVRRSDGHLIYQENNYSDPVREFVRDAVPLVTPDAGTRDWRTGEPQLDSGSLPCNPGETMLTTQRRFKLGWDEKLYHTCGNYDAVPPPSDPEATAWYDAAGNLMYMSKVWLARVGAHGVAIGTRGTSELVVITFNGGAELASIDVTGQDVIATRMREDGFWVALRDQQTHDRTWLDIDLSGKVAAHGAYAPLPNGIAYVGQGNAWSDGGAAALDGIGRLYEFAADTTDSSGAPLVVRRPRGEGSSDVPYRGNPNDPTPTRDIFLQEPVFFTGG